MSFFEVVGLPDNLIEYLPSLVDQAIQYYSCFTSYSIKDDEFAKRIHADLQNNGVRRWFASHDLRIGDKTLDAIDAAIRVRDKLLVILSENSIGSEWVEDEVNTAAYEEERRRDATVLFPIRLDDAVMETNGEARIPPGFGGRCSRSKALPACTIWFDFTGLSFERGAFSRSITLRVLSSVAVRGRCASNQA